MPQATPLARDEALAELTRRYFTSHGPATVQDFVWWSGLTVADVKAGLALLVAQLSQEVIDGQTYWFSSATPAVNDKVVMAHLLPVFDEYTVAYKDRSAVFDPAHTKKLGGRGDVLSNHTIVVAGQIVGIWQRTVKKDAVVIETNIFTRSTKAENRAVAAAVQRYGEFLGLPVAHEA